MGIFNYKRRLFFSALLIAAFFIPAYNNVSAFGFILLALKELRTQTDITFVDLVVVLVPLIFIPLMALVIFIRSMTSRSSRLLLRSLPLLCLIFFFLIFIMGIDKQTTANGIMELVKNIGLGLYIAACASIFLIFTEDKGFREPTIDISSESDN